MMNHRRVVRIVFRWMYWIGTILWCFFCFAGTVVGLHYHSLDAVAPQVLEGLAIALIPAVLVYLLFRRFGVFS